jgi:hypothetical protein
MPLISELNQDAATIAYAHRGLLEHLKASKVEMFPQRFDVGKKEFRLGAASTTYRAKRAF